MKPSPDTIAAIATPPGRGGIGIVRVSGSSAAAIAEAIVGRTPEPRRATHAAFRGDGDALLDEGLALFFAAPRSYTGEDVLELHGHGGPAVLRLVLGRCIGLGARLARPGEFTERAFLNDKLDLAQAEGVADLIDAATGAAARAAARSLSGAFSREVQRIVDAVIELRMLTEATLDFPEEDIDFVRAADAAGRVDTLRGELDDVLARARQGALLREGLTVVLVGATNVGKSSLLNRLAREDVAIVTDIPGTTRDPLKSAVELMGIPLTVVDTAGLRPTDDPIETIGIARAWQAVSNADVALVLREAGHDDVPVAPEIGTILGGLPTALPRIVIHNKIDLVGLPARRMSGPQERRGSPVAHEVWLSARTGEGIDLLEVTILELAHAQGDMEGTFLARTRHLEALRAARAHVEAAAAHLARATPPLELLAEELREAQTALAAITGEFTADDLLGVIFSRFCIGK